jgi:abortive infection bacteriophage resistance protein
LRLLVSYSKPHLTYPQQVELLVQRGMAIGDPAGAAGLLSRIGYYRLSGYWYPYRETASFGESGRSDNFKSGTTLEHVLALYNMDRQLKLLVLDFIERIEVAVRVRIGYILGERHPYAHLEPQHLDGRFSRSPQQGASHRYERWLRRIEEAQERSTEDFVRHFRQFYDGRMPIWVVTEIMDFGLLSNLYSGAKRIDRDRIAKELHVVDPGGRGNGVALENWLRVLNYLRNICAHHARLWNRNMTVQIASSHLTAIPMLRHLGGTPSLTDRVYAPLCILGFLLRRIAPELQWSMMLQELLDNGLEAAKRGIYEMGFPHNWREQTVWR